MSSVPPVVRGTSTSRVPLHAGARTPVAAPRKASVPPRYRRFLTPTDPAATLWPSDAVADAYLAPGCFSPGPGGLHQFQCNPSLRAAVLTPPESAAAVSQRSSAADAAFATVRVARLPVITFTRLAQRSMPAAHSVAPRPASGLSGGTAPRFRHSDASPQLHGSLAVTVSSFFSLAGLHRLSSGHAIPNGV